MSPADYRRRQERIANLREREKLSAFWLRHHAEEARLERIELEAIQQELCELGVQTEVVL